MASWDITFGDRLRRLRVSRGLTQQQIADALGLHRPSITVIECGRQKVTGEQIDMLAELLHVPAGYLVNGWSS